LIIHNVELYQTKLDDIVLHKDNIIYVCLYVEELDSPVHMDEVFKQTHIWKNNGEFIDKGSRRIVVS